MNRKEKLMTPAKYSEILLGTARESQAGSRKLLATGIGPMAWRKVENTAERVASGNSFASIVTKWLEHWQDGKSPRHVVSTRHRLKAIILPRWVSAPSPNSKHQSANAKPVTLQNAL